MTPRQAVWVVLALSFVMLSVSIYLVRENLVLRDGLRETRSTTLQLTLAQREACGRANLRREQDRYTLRVVADMAVVLARSDLTDTDDTAYFLATARELRERLTESTLQPLDCVALYPLPGGG